jgi:OFA family oxalate/formate antiporter-like MFS transporter
MRLQSRWIILAIATISMMVIGLYQYSWTIFVTPLRDEFGWSLATVQLTFTLFVWIMTWTQPVAGYIADQKGPRYLAVLGGIIASVGWIMTSFINDSTSLYFSYSLGAVGVGIIYAISVGLASKWFPDRRGLANGFTSFGYGFGAAILNPVISVIIANIDFRAAFLYMGVVILFVLIGLSLIARYPPSNWMSQVTSQTGPQSLRDFPPQAVIQSRQWWQIYAAFIVTSSIGLMITSQLTPMGQAFNLSENIVLTATVVFPIFNGLGRLFGGFVSDKFGREKTMTLFFALQGTCSLLLLLLGSIELLFIGVICLIGLFWGPIFTFFPSITADYFGRQHSTTNYGITYTAKAWGGLFGGYIVAWLVTSFQSFTTPILMSAIFGFIATLLVFPKLLRRPTSAA